jgi:ribosomal protein S12 methylthiotransferase accessory factor
MMSTNPERSRPAYKACVPERTVSRARDILGALGTVPSECDWRHAGSVASVTLRLLGLPGVVQGKGPTEAYALASAYGELMERLQTQFIEMVAPVWGPGGRALRWRYDDEVAFDETAFTQWQPEVMRTLKQCQHAHEHKVLARLLAQPELGAVPFYHVDSGRVALLPLGLRELTNGNGCAAGNTPAEAVTQGLCEIFERHALCELYRRRTYVCPTLPDALLRPLSPWRHIERLRRQGYAVHVKDCSLGGELPVAGVVVSRQSSSGTHARFSIGAAPSVAVAIERCITELLQGHGDEGLAGTLTRVDGEAPLPDQRSAALYRQLHMGIAPVHPTLLVHDIAVNPAHLGQNDDLVSEGTARAMLALARRYGRGTFIRDASVLGFPAYWIYVCGLSELPPPRLEGYAALLPELAAQRQVLRRIDDASPAELRGLADVLRRLREETSLGPEEQHYLMLGLMLDRDARFYRMPLKLLQSMLYARLGDLAAAAKALDAQPGRPPSAEDGPAIQGVVACCDRILRALHGGASLASASAATSAEFPQAVVAAATALLDPKTSLARAFGIPRCEGCGSCPYARQCFFPAQQRLFNALTQHRSRVTPDQTALAELVPGAAPRAAHCDAAVGRRATPPDNTESMRII